MALDRGTLARIDRRVFAELGNATATQVVKVPLSDTAWSTWRRYCAATGLSVGEGVAGLIAYELGALVDDEERSNTLLVSRRASLPGLKPSSSGVAPRGAGGVDGRNRASREHWDTTV